VRPIPQANGEGNGVVRCPASGTRNRLRGRGEGVPRCGRCKSLLPWLTSATTSTFEEEIRAPVPVIVDFWAPWCMPCSVVKPGLERLAADYAGKVKVVEVNVDDEPQLAQRFQAMSIPLLVVFRNGDELDRIVGAVPPAELERRLRPILGSMPEPAGSPK
jgi:thioredoxin 2